MTFYIHYDGQASDPKEWTRGAAVRAGGSTATPASICGDQRPDRSGAAHLRALDIRRQGADRRVPRGDRRLAAANATLPWNINVVLDGEEEGGSPNFTPAMNANAEKVRGDLAVIVDSPRHPSGLPTVFYGSRGGASAVIKVYGANGDLHSGDYGNFVTDPTMALAKLLASMKDDKGNVVVKTSTTTWCR